MINGQIKRKEDGAKSEPAKKPESNDSAASRDANVASIKPALKASDGKPSTVAQGMSSMKPTGGKPLTG